MDDISTHRVLLFSEIRQLIEETRNSVAVLVNAGLTMLYWKIGKRINTEILDNTRAAYGKEIIHNISSKLTEEFGKGWSEKQLRHCLRIAEVFPDEKIIYALSRELSWTHLRSLIYVKNALKRDFYIEMVKLEKWSSRLLRERMNSMLYERTAISKKPDKTIDNDLKLLKNKEHMSPDLVFRDPYFLDFLGLSDTYAEKDLESAILAEMQRFIIELGNDFAFMACQKRIIIDNRDYYIDLLFYHRRLKSLVVIEPKLGEFEAAYKGQMELYLRYLEKYEKVEGENSPVGIILCSGKNEEHIELLQLDKSNIRVSEYLTELPTKELLKQKLHKAIKNAKLRLT